MEKALVLLAILFQAGFFAHGQAADSQLAGRNYDASRESEIAQRSRKRLYPGGRDEADLKVQQQLANPVRKVAPSIHINTESTGED